MPALLYIEGTARKVHWEKGGSEHTTAGEKISIFQKGKENPLRPQQIAPLFQMRLAKEREADRNHEKTKRLF